MNQELAARFAAAWEKHREMQRDLQNILDLKPEHRNDWANNYIETRSRDLNAFAELLNQENEAGLIMVEAWIQSRKDHSETLLKLASATDAIMFYREWMANRGGGKLDPDTPYIDHAYIKQVEAKFQKFIKYGYWTFGDEKYPDEEGYVAPTDED